MVRSKLIRKGVIMVGNKNIGGLYKPLSDAQVETIHNAALTILEDVGITYTPDQSDLIEELGIAGARIEQDESRIRFDRKLIEQALSYAPDRLVLYNRYANRQFCRRCHGSRYKAMTLSLEQIVMNDEIWKTGTFVHNVHNERLFHFDSQESYSIGAILPLYEHNPGQPLITDEA